MVGTVQQVRLPGVGEAAALVPEHGAADCLTVHVLATAGPAPESVRVVLDDPPRDGAAAFHDDPVWLSSGGHGTSRAWFQAHATTLDADGVLVELAEVVLAAVETRRESVRAPLPGHGTLHVGHGPSRITGELVDISPGGCRLRVPGHHLPHLGQGMDLVATLEAGLLLRTPCTVVRIDDRSPTELGLRFDGLPPADAMRLQREVLRAAWSAEHAGDDRS